MIHFSGQRNYLKIYWISIFEVTFSTNSKIKSCPCQQIYWSCMHIPDTNCLSLVGQMVLRFSVKVKRVHDSRADTVEILQTTCRQFHQNYTYKYFVRTSFFYVHVTRKSCQNATFVRIFRTFNVDEIDTCRQFHQHYTREFFLRMSFRLLFYVRK